MVLRPMRGLEETVRALQDELIRLGFLRQVRQVWARHAPKNGRQGRGSRHLAAILAELRIVLWEWEGLEALEAFDR